MKKRSVDAGSHNSTQTPLASQLAPQKTHKNAARTINTPSLSKNNLGSVSQNNFVTALGMESKRKQQPMGKLVDISAKTDRPSSHIENR